MRECLSAQKHFERLSAQVAKCIECLSALWVPECLKGLIVQEPKYPNALSARYFYMFFSTLKEIMQAQSKTNP